MRFNTRTIITRYRYNAAASLATRSRGHVIAHARARALSTVCVSAVLSHYYVPRLRLYLARHYSLNLEERGGGEAVLAFAHSREHVAGPDTSRHHHPPCHLYHYHFQLTRRESFAGRHSPSDLQDWSGVAETLLRRGRTRKTRDTRAIMQRVVLSGVSPQLRRPPSVNNPADQTAAAIG
jgi:hypothetical protein